MKNKARTMLYKEKNCYKLGLFFHYDYSFFFLVVCMYWRKRRFFSLFLPFRGNDYKFNMGQNSKESKHSMDQYFKKLQYVSLKYVWQEMRFGTKQKPAAPEMIKLYFKALALVFWNVQNGTALLYFKTNLRNVSHSGCRQVHQIEYTDFLCLVEQQKMH